MLALGPALRRMLFCALSVVAFYGSVSVAEAVNPRMIQTARADYAGIQHLQYRYGPIAIRPGQNTIDLKLNQLKPKVPGYITYFKPDLVYSGNRGVPRVDVLHLHHGVWLINLAPTFAAGEEKSIAAFPQGYGLHHDPTDAWVMNWMIHNLTPGPDSVYIVYDLDFVPDTAPGAQSIKPAHVQWMDVAGVSLYPVFDVKRGSGRHGRYTFPDDAKGREREKIGLAQKWFPNKDVTLLGTIGHLHPGGLWTDLSIVRGKQKKRVFRSAAEYFEPAGAVSWDVATTATRPGWSVAVRAGRSVEVSATYDTSRASWYESMGIMPVIYTDGIEPRAKDPFTDRIETTGQITHGPLKENRNHGGQLLGLPDARRLRSGRAGGTVRIEDFIYGRGDLGLTGVAGRPPAIRAGQRLTFDNSADDKRTIWHTITACKSPCNRSTGIAYPLANGAGDFDSGELGTGSAGATAASNRLKWKTPKSLRPGTYTYFCRVHPFMRGAFRVVPKARKS